MTSGTSVTFRAVLATHGRSAGAIGIEVPDEVVETLGHGKRPPVRVTMNGHTYPSTIARMGGRFLLPVNAANRAQAGVAAGDELDVTVTLDAGPREVTVPDELAAALAAVPGARERFDALAFSRRKEHARSVEEAKRPETRARRIDAVVHAMR